MGSEGRYTWDLSYFHHRQFHETKGIAVAIGAITYFHLSKSAAQSPRIQIRTILNPGTATDIEEYSLPAAECGTAISGRLGFQIMGHTSILEAGDSFAFDEAASHRFWCEGDAPVEILMVTTPAIY
ncbi:cupin domain-containing protein [Rhizobium sp. RCC_161_2]|uniref:cupin domain-containing protein n=1 Tax=Rhizobium sp. RCC_161_2 TaxID=3239219 RepID=UPI00352458E3